jgi:hypothetical protein
MSVSVSRVLTVCSRMPDTAGGRRRVRGRDLCRARAPVLLCRSVGVLTALSLRRAAIIATQRASVRLAAGLSDDHVAVFLSILAKKCAASSLSLADASCSRHAVRPDDATVVAVACNNLAVARGPRDAADSVRTRTQFVRTGLTRTGSCGGWRQRCRGPRAS